MMRMAVCCRPISTYVCLCLTVKSIYCDENGSIIQAYIHQHVWLLFASMALSMAHIIYQDGGSGIHGDYVQTAAQLHGQCIELVTSCLLDVPSQGQNGECIFIG